MQQTVFHVISHTHWDREWYLPFETFRVELVELIDNLLTVLKQDKSFIFHLDGQAIILQDYLDIRPNKKEEIKKYIKSGNILVGPWYILSDQFLSSGESTVRNLLYGLRISQEFGSPMLVGYCPDQFGQIAQLPQIFKGFNINSAIIGRGIKDGFAEHNWHGLDGSSILAVALTHWYNNAQRLPENGLKDYIEGIYKNQSPTSKSKHILLMNGCDHLFPQTNLTTVINSSNNGKWQIKLSNLPGAISEMANSASKKDYPQHFGELRDDNNRFILAGTLSSRVYLKLSNYKCQTKLEKTVEPLLALVDVLKSKLSSHSWIPGHSDLLKYAWKLLIQNHAHDSICGCSTDEVHKEMETRFLKVEQVLDKIKEDILLGLSSSNLQDDNKCLQVINLSNYKRNDIVEVELEFPLSPLAEDPGAEPLINKSEIKNLVLERKGKPIDSVILESNVIKKMVRSKDEVPLLQVVQKIKLLFQAEVEPFSITTYEAKTQTFAPRHLGTLALFNNQSYKLEINNDGTLSIALNNSHCFKNTHFITVEDDLGDEYHFMPSTNKEQKLNSWSIETVEENIFRKRFLLQSTIPDLKVDVEVICYASSNRIDFRTKIDNKLKNKRIRLHFPTQLNTNYITADTPFGMLLRARPPVDWVDSASSQPLYNWIDHSNSIVGLSFFGGGLADYELYKDGNGFAITLLRAVGKLSNVKSHSLIHTVDAQCNRVIQFDYSICPHLADWKDALVHQESITHQTRLVTNQSKGKLDIPKIMDVDSRLVVSALKKAEDKENVYILRLFNPYNETLSSCNIKVSCQSVCLMNLNEEIISDFKQENSLCIDVDPYKIVTIGIKL